ncbi:MAG: NAD(P)-dependent oxidoreductase [Betaproteobacteria bacterium]|nr:NAD(P)-dependent oxidoreductase [Betaproteobacteria bacterium]
MARTVGMLGLGIMGAAMATNLLRAGLRVVGYDPISLCRRRLRRAGGIAVSSIEEVFGSCSVLISSLPSVNALRAVARSVPSRRRRKQVVIETSTLPIAAKQAARRRLAAAGVTLLDCPLSGTGAQARSGDLVVYGSGNRFSYRRALPILRGFSRAQYYLGDFGNGSKMKFAANLLVAIHNVSAAEAVILARSSGLDPKLAVKVLGDGAGASRMLQVRGPMMAKRRYRDATMKVEVWQKDMKIIGAFVRRLRSPAPLFTATKAIYNAALRRGYGKADTAAVCAVLERRRSDGVK